MRQKMGKEDLRRLFASAAAMFAAPLLLNCSGHYCRCGHLAHDAWVWPKFLNDIGWIILIPIAFVFAFRSNIRLRKTFMLIVAIAIPLHVYVGGLPTIILAPVLLLLGILGIIIPRKKCAASQINVDKDSCIEIADTTLSDS